MSGGSNVDNLNTLTSKNGENIVNNVSGGGNEDNLNTINDKNSGNIVNTVNNVQAVYSAVLPPSLMVFLYTYVLFFLHISSFLSKKETLRVVCSKATC